MRRRRNEEAVRRRFSRRAVLAGGVQVAALSVVGWRLFDLQVLGQRRYGPLADENRISLQALAPMRGRILDRSKRVLADNDEIFRATLTPALARDVAAVLANFRRLVSLTPDEVERLARRMKQQSRNLPTVIKSDLTFDEVARIGVFAPELPGVKTEIAWKRRYRGGPSVGHVVGYVGSIERFGIDDEAVMRLPDMRIGKSGAEAGFESALRGTGGAQKVEVDARGRIVRDLETIEAIAGRDVTLSIDLALQQAVMARLQQERRAAIVVLDVATGEIRAMAATPSYDPADVAEGITEESWRRFVFAEDKPLLNRAVAGQYPPGSTFKIVTALAALRAGAVRADEPITCTGRYDYADQTYRCWKRDGHGPVAMKDALRLSCDGYFFELARRLGIEALADAARQCGLGVVHDCGLPEEKAGLVPDPDWKRGRWNAGWLGGETILAGIGQGYMLATPLQLAVMTARVATGRGVVPRLERHATGVPPADFSRLVFPEADLAVVRDGMLAAVNESGGTGVKAFLGIGRPLVAGKTGTSQVARPSSDVPQDSLPWGQRDHALFVAYMPAGAPRLAAAAIVEHGGNGSAAAAPLVRDVLTLMLDQEAAGDRRPPAQHEG